MRFDLSCAERIAIRSLAADSDYPVHHDILAALHRMGLVDDSNALTPQGYRAHAYIMQSGDGPEGLKDMFGGLVR